MKKSPALLLGVLLLALMVAGCSSPGTDANDAAAPGTADGTGSQAAAGPDLAEVHAVVFDDEITDPMILNTVSAPGSEGTAILNMTLYETGPGVFAGDGMLERAIKMNIENIQESDMKMSSRLSFQDLKPGDSGRCDLLMFVDNEIGSYWGDGEDYGVYRIHALVTQHTTAEYSFKMNGDSAEFKMTIGVFEFVFGGRPGMVSPARASTAQLDGRCISVNSTFMETGRENNRESRAMLTATQVSGLEYKGDFCAFGSGTGRPYIDESVSFTLEPFEAQAYAAAGGSLPGSFDAFGVIASSGGDYIVLIDGEKVRVEDTSYEAVFTGGLPPADQAESLQWLADESKQLMHTLYEHPDPSRYANALEKQFWPGKPPWYPDWLMPTPIDPTDWRHHQMSNVALFNQYTTQYTEEAVAYDVFDPYKEHLSGLDNYALYETEAGDFFYFNKGVYRVQMMLTYNATSVDVDITIT